MGLFCASIRGGSRSSAGRPLRISALLGVLLIPVPAAALDKVRLQLRFDHQFQFAGYYAAHWLGYYSEAGLEVEILSGVRSDLSMIDTTDAVQEGRAEFGVGSGDILWAIDRGVPLTVVASIFQQSPVELFARREARLMSPADLPELRVLQDPSPLVQAEILAMLNAEGMSPGSVDFLHEPEQMSVLERIRFLLTGQVDVMPGYNLSIPWYAREAGVSLTSLRPAAYGVDFYGDSLFTHARLAEQNPDLVERFRDASLKGWRYAMANPDQIIERIVADLPRRLPVQDPLGYNQFLAGQIRTLTKYPVIEIGHINPDRWRMMHESLQRAGVVVHSLTDMDWIFDPERIENIRLKTLLNQTLQAALAIFFLAGLTFIMYLMRAKRRLEISELRYRSLFDESPISIWEEDFSAVRTYLDEHLVSKAMDPREFLESRPDVVDECIKRVRMLDVNQAALKIFEAGSKQELLHCLGDLLTDASRDVVREELIALVNGDSEFETETTVRTLRGGERKVDLRLSMPPSAQERWQRVVVMIADHTERERAEKLLHYYALMVSVTEDMMAYLDRDCRYLAVNESYCLALVKDRKSILGTHVESQLDPGIYHSHVKPNLERCLGGKPVSYDLSTAFPGTGDLELRVNYFPVLADDGGVEGVVVHLHDVTDQRELERELNDYHEHLERLVTDRTEKLTFALQELESFSYSVSHDLRAPLRSINGFSTALVEDLADSLPETARTYILRIQRNALKMEEQIDGLLSLARITRGDMDCTEIDLSLIVRDLTDKYAQLYPDNGIELSIDPGVVAYADPRMIEIALDNLVANAFKFSASKETIRLEFGQARLHDEAVIYIRDNGIGFDMKYSDKLFVAFQRLHAEYEGHGIGLATVQRVILRHGGKLWAESMPGQGATFYFCLPSAEEVALLEAPLK